MLSVIVNRLAQTMLMCEYCLFVCLFHTNIAQLSDPTVTSERLIVSNLEYATKCACFQPATVGKVVEYFTESYH